MHVIVDIKMSYVDFPENCKHYQNIAHLFVWAS